MWTGHSEALISPLGVGRGGTGVQSCLGQECDMGQSSAWSPEVLPTRCLPRDVVVILGGCEPPGASKEGPPAKLPDSAWLCAVDPAPVWVSIGSPWPRPCFAGPFLQPGLPACVLASFPSRLLVNPPGAQLTPWHAAESLDWLSGSP